MLGKSLDGYLLVGCIGSGGFGSVYLGLELRSGLKVAVKLLSAKRQDTSQREMLMRNFDREARALAALSHPSIVRLYKYGMLHDQPYLVMEFLEGAVRLDAEMRRHYGASTWFDHDEIVTIIEQLLFALEHAHSRGILHRDLKPDNILLQHPQGHPVLVRLLDFGLAKHLSAGEETQHIVGTPSYMAPEQIRGLRLGVATDLYSLAVVALELLTGRKPFPQKGHEAVFQAKLDPAYDPTQVLLPLSPPPQARDFFRRALSPEPSLRPQSAAAFRQALTPLLQTLGQAVPMDPLEGRSTDEKPFNGDQVAVERWLEREKSRLATPVRKKGSKEWDI